MKTQVHFKVFHLLGRHRSVLIYWKIHQPIRCYTGTCYVYKRASTKYLLKKVERLPVHGRWSTYSQPTRPPPLDPFLYFVCAIVHTHTHMIVDTQSLYYTYTHICAAALIRARDPWRPVFSTRGGWELVCQRPPSSNWELRHWVSGRVESWAGEIALLGSELDLADKKPGRCSKADESNKSVSSPKGTPQRSSSGRTQLSLRGSRVDFKWRRWCWWGGGGPACLLPVDPTTVHGAPAESWVQCKEKEGAACVSLSLFWAVSPVSVYTMYPAEKDGQWVWSEVRGSRDLPLFPFSSWNAGEKEASSLSTEEQWSPLCPRIHSILIGIWLLTQTVIVNKCSQEINSCADRKKFQNFSEICFDSISIIEFPIDLKILLLILQRHIQVPEM